MNQNQAITMTPEQVNAAISGLDLKTYKGWIAAAIALLQDKPAGTAIEDQGGYLVLIDSGLCCLAGFSDGRTTYEMEDGSPVDGGEPDLSAWDDERCCWDGLESSEKNMRTLTAPVFVTLTFVDSEGRNTLSGEHTRILTKAQAQEVFSAMRHLNKVNALLSTFIRTDSGHFIEIHDEGNGIALWSKEVDLPGKETHASQSAFAAAYGLQQEDKDGEDFASWSCS